MRLCDKDIEAALQAGVLTITPRPPADRISGVTVDVRLGNEFRVFQDHAVACIDLAGPREALSLALNAVVSPPIRLDEGAAFFLHPGRLALGVTHETVALPDHLVGWLDGRSSLARLGLMVHVTAHRLDPGWNGQIVLEFYNAGPVPLALKPGMLIGAISFETMTGPAAKPYASRKASKYRNQAGAMRSRLDHESPG